MKIYIKHILSETKMANKEKLDEIVVDASYLLNTEEAVVPNDVYARDGTIPRGRISVYKPGVPCNLHHGPGHIYGGIKPEDLY